MMNLFKKNWYFYIQVLLMPICINGIGEKAYFYLRNYTEAPVIHFSQTLQHRNFPSVKAFSPTNLKWFNEWSEFSKQNLWELSGQYEGDMLLSNYEANLMYNTQGTEGVPKIGLLWPKKEVPYAFDMKAHFSKEQRVFIEATLSSFEHETCVRVRPYKDGDRDYVVITSNTSAGCVSWIGRKGGAQIINLPSAPVGQRCLYEGNILHVFLHTFGLFHTHSSQLRDDFIKFDYKNIRYGYEKYFEKFLHVPIFTKEYDYSSLRHYSAYAFSKNGLPTVLSKFKDKKIMGQRQKLSDLDIHDLQALYHCTLTETAYEAKDSAFWKKWSQRLPVMDKDFRMRAPWTNEYSSNENELAPNMIITITKSHVRKVARKIPKDDIATLDRLQLVSSKQRKEIFEWTVQNKQHIWELGSQTEGDMILTNAQRTLLLGRNVHPKIFNRLWPRRLIPYEILNEDEYFSSDTSFIHSTLHSFNNISCVSVRKRRKTESNYLLITSDSHYGWAAQVGHLKGIVHMNVVPFNRAKNMDLDQYRAALLHTFMHILGFYHEHAAPNQGDYISVNFSHVDARSKSNFNIFSASVVTNFGLPYDYNSIMHISEYAFTSDGHKTINILEPNVTLKHPVDLSELDKEKLRRMYNCPRYT